MQLEIMQIEHIGINHVKMGNMQNEERQNKKCNDKNVERYQLGNEIKERFFMMVKLVKTYGCASIDKCFNFS